MLTKKRQQIDTYAVSVEGDRRTTHPRYYTAIRVVHEISGRNVDDRAVERSIELSATRYCVVSATIANGHTRIEHHFRISDEAGEREGAGVTIGPNGAGIVLSGEPPA